MTITEEYWNELIDTINRLKEQKKYLEFTLRVLEEEQNKCSKEFLKKF